MNAQSLLEVIAQVGRTNPMRPALQDVEIFRHYFDERGRLNEKHLDERDGACTRRELLLRYLLLNAVLDQGPDSDGVRILLVRVTNALYRDEVRFLHQPAEYFRELGIAVNQITSTHDAVKELRAVQWARANQTRASKYNLFLENTKQVLNYAVFRWGVPLAVPLLLTKDEHEEEQRPMALQRYLESWPSAEVMSQQIKDHPRYGLGKAIGDKAAHLFAKWMTYSYPLTTKSNDAAWGPFSFEVPFDSNAGRVLFRTGFFGEWASLNQYAEWQVIQKGRGKEGKHYVRVTNIRGKGSQRAERDRVLRQAYAELATVHLKTHKRPPSKIEIQRIPLAFLLLTKKFTPGQLDDGLMHVGTKFCFNHSEPACSGCPIRDLCEGHRNNRALIEDYRT
jgi:hypothetical protein